METYIAWVQENWWETEPFDIGVYSSKEKAENAILMWINNESSEPWLSLEIYSAQNDARYIFGTEKFILDESPIE